MIFGCTNQFSTQYNDLPIRGFDFTKNIKPYEGEPILIAGTNIKNDDKMAENIGFSKFGYSSVDKFNFKKAVNFAIDRHIHMMIIYPNKIEGNGIYGYGASYWYDTHRKVVFGAFCRETGNSLKITYVKPKTAAKSQNLRENDEILALNDQKMTKIDDFISFCETNSGKNVIITLQRNREIIQKEIKLN